MDTTAPLRYTESCHRCSARSTRSPLAIPHPPFVADPRYTRHRALDGGGAAGAAVPPVHQVPVCVPHGHASATDGAGQGAWRGRGRGWGCWVQCRHLGRGQGKSVRGRCCRCCRCRRWRRGRCAKRGPPTPGQRDVQGVCALMMLGHCWRRDSWWEVGPCAVRSLCQGHVGLLVNGGSEV